ncbi:hypothetical protein GKZ68_20665 (plasmid) [Hymenobacter sp. BRD128]|uniref:hypothetical protein n=1 Tax=Hymenobacter sp. BRD128 TaxID=2675878 RepID=UPI00156609D0|nr:hypothetical protein [Hymenobacter sp. BRD128]QKG59097.1 hypothetical protein GKZ68_20665 [Hymenobacter sp. BRD128]
MPDEIQWLYRRYYSGNVGLGSPRLSCPVTPSDIELSFTEAHIVLTLARCPRVFNRRLSVSFLPHYEAYLLDAAFLLQLVGGAGQVWRRICSQPGLPPHWRPLIYYESFRDGFVGRPWDWPDKELPVPDPVYNLPPGTDETIHACLTPLEPS